jgi:multidrug efflux pump subunit AcrB
LLLFSIALQVSVIQLSVLSRQEGSTREIVLLRRDDCYKESRECSFHRCGRPPALTLLNGTPVLIKDLGTVSFGPDIREGVAVEREGKTVGGIVVMRYGLNALNVTDGVMRKLAEIKGSLPPGVEVVARLRPCRTYR